MLEWPEDIDLETLLDLLSRYPTRYRQSQVRLRVDGQSLVITGIELTEGGELWLRSGDDWPMPTILSACVSKPGGKPMADPSPGLTPDELRLIQKLLDALAEQLGRDDYGWSYEDERLRLQVREVIDRELNKE